MKFNTLKVTLLTTLSVIMLSGVIVPAPDSGSGKPDSGTEQPSSENETPSGEDGISPLSDLDESRLG